MSESEYTRIFREQMNKWHELKDQRDAINEQMRGVSQMARAALNMVPNEDRIKLATSFWEVMKSQEGLTEAIRNILFANRGQWTTAVQVKELLDKSGFDFSGYTSNPLSSIHSVLKRFKKEEVKSVRLMSGSHGYQLTKRAAKERAGMASALQVLPEQTPDK